MSFVLEEIADGRTTIAAVAHPLGFVCLPLRREGERGVCVHAWRDDVPQVAPTTSFIHAHSWDLFSYVLYGAIRNNVIEITDTVTDPTHRVAEIRSTGPIDEIRPTGRLVRSAAVATELTSRNAVYTLDGGIFHTSVVDGHAATLAFSSACPGAIDLSLADLDTPPHLVRRRYCDRVETAHIAREVLARLQAGGTRGPIRPPEAGGHRRL
ncbi:hypothetical protein AB0E01_13265 [Nocardia vinacea]|uniref:hypothetical protein n=1 Tax=Nocardia vinacea TaxID=96468 RepID=UPI0033DD594B